MGAKEREEVRRLLGDAVGGSGADGCEPAGVRFVFQGPVTIIVAGGTERRRLPQLVFDEDELDVKTG